MLLNAVVCIYLYRRCKVQLKKIRLKSDAIFLAYLGVETIICLLRISSKKRQSQFEKGFLRT